MVNVNKPVGRIVLLKNTNLFVSSCAISGLHTAVSFVPHLVSLNALEVFYRPGFPVEVAVLVLKQAFYKPSSYS